MVRFWKALKKILLFELLWKLLCLGLVNPVFRDVYQTRMASVGLNFNGSAFWSFLDPRAGLLFLLLFIATSMLIFYEISVIINITALCRSDKEFYLTDVMKSSFWNLRVMKGWSLALGSLYYILLLPLLRLGYVNTMVPSVSIPEFVFDEMRKSQIGMIGILAIHVLRNAVHLLLTFVPPGMVLRCQRFGQAARGSLDCWKKMGWKYRLALVGYLISWERIFTEIARFWRRTTLGNDDFDGKFLQYLIYSEAFRKDLLYWTLLAVLLTAGMAGFVYLQTAVLEKTGGVCVQLQPPWNPDAASILDIMGRRWTACKVRWRQRFRKRRWQLGTAAVFFAFAAYLFLSLSQPLLVHRPIAIGHRGSSLAVENTLPAILAAGKHGMDYAEIDVQLTRDGVPVVFHDGNLLRLAGRSESIGDLDWAQIQEIRIHDLRYDGAAEHIPSLEEVLLAVSDQTDMGLLMELKPTGYGGMALAEAVMELVERYQFEDRTIVMSLDYLCLTPIMEKHPDWWIGYCAYSAVGDIADAVWRYGVDFLAVEESLISNRLMGQARELDLPVYVWSVYDTEKMLQYLEMGVTGIISDYPEELSQVLGDYIERHSHLEYQREGRPPFSQ